MSTPASAPSRYEDCPDPSRHAQTVYGDRWAQPYGTYPRLDGRSVARTHKQTRCPACGFYVVWTPRAAVSPSERADAGERPVTSAGRARTSTGDPGSREP